MQLGDDSNVLSFSGTHAKPTHTYNGNVSYGIGTAGGLVLSNLATASLPSSPATGTIFYDTTKASPVTYNGSAYTSALSADGTEPLTANWNVGSYTITATTFIGAVTGNVTGDLTPASESAEHGAGAIGTGTQTAPVTKRWIEGGTIITQVTFDITGLGMVGTSADDVIGLVAGGAAFIGRYVVATDGVCFRTELSCVEVPGEGTATITQDIDITVNSSAALAYDGAASTGQLHDTAALIAGETVTNNSPLAILTANDYFYITEGDTTGTTGVYNAGQFVFTRYGRALLT